MKGYSLGPNHFAQDAPGGGFSNPSRSKICLANVDIVTLPAATTVQTHVLQFALRRK
jgi:hypothetical protein